MRFFLLFFFSSFIVLVLSCDRKKQNPPPPQEAEAVPEALQEDGPRSTGYKRRPLDLLDQLYADVEKSDPVLQELATKNGELWEQRADSGELLASFFSKNGSYYEAAREHAGTISDSLLKMRLQTLINNSLRQYEARVMHGKSMEQTIDHGAATLKDLMEALRIVKTLPLIEKYQQTNHPSLKPLEAVLKEYNKAIRVADSLVRK